MSNQEEQSSKTDFVVIKNKNGKYLSTMNYGNNLALTDKIFDPMSFFYLSNAPKGQIDLRTYLSTPVYVTDDNHLATNQKTGDRSSYLKRSKKSPRKIYIKTNGKKKYLCSDLKFHENPEDNHQWYFYDKDYPTLKLKNLHNDEEKGFGNIHMIKIGSYVCDGYDRDGNCRKLYFENFFLTDTGNLVFKASQNGFNKKTKKIKNGNLVNSNDDDSCYIVPRNLE